MTKLSDLISELDKVQKFYIEGHKNRDIKTLAKDIGARIPCVRAYISYLDRVEKKRKKKEEEESKKAQPITTPISGHIKADELMVKKRGSIIMTPESSQLSDTTRKKSTLGPNLAKNIQKIRPNWYKTF